MDAGSVFGAVLNELERFRAKYTVCPTTGCWNWTASCTSNGYGQFHINSGAKRNVGAHRWAYETLVGCVPDGLQLDHLCRNRRCVNPAHLEPVTPQVNTLRGATLPARNARKTHCPQGHMYGAPGPDNRRRCPECNKAKSLARYYARHRTPEKLASRAQQARSRWEGRNAS